MPKDQPEPRFDKPQDVVNVVYTIAAAHAACVTPFIRSRFGCRAFKSYWMAFLLMVAYAGFANCPLLAWYTVPWLVMIVIRRLTAHPNRHSLCQGYPWVFGWMTNELVARIAEVFIVFFAAVFAAMVSQPLANFLLLEIPSLMIVLATESATLQARKTAMRDAQIQARQMSDLSRGGNGW